MSEKSAANQVVIETDARVEDHVTPVVAEELENEGMVLTTVDLAVLKTPVVAEELENEGMKLSAIDVAVLKTPMVSEELGNGGMMLPAIDLAVLKIPVVAEELENEGTMPPAMDLAVLKTPVTVLQELCAKRWITPDYELVNQEGPLHTPFFKVKVAIDDFVEYGVGSSKKRAKHAAARAMLLALVGTHDAKYFLTPEEAVKEEEVGCDGGADGSGKEDKQVPQGESDVEAPRLSSPTDQLNKYRSSMFRSWPQPFYEIVEELTSGESYPSRFRCVCRVAQLSTTACGLSKRAARQNAAEEMLSLLKKLDRDNKLRVPKCGIGKLLQRVSFHKKLPKKSEDSYVWKLLEIEFKDDNIDYVQLLLRVAEEMQFSVDFMDADDGGMKQSIVYLATIPATQCIGKGETEEKAMNAAAQQAVMILKYMVMVKIDYQSVA